MALFELAPYVSEREEEEEDVLEEPPVKRRRGLGREWNKEEVFKTAKEAEKYVEDESTWSRDSVTDTDEGRKVYFRCYKSPFRQEGSCQSAVYLLYHADSLKVNKLNKIV